MPDARRIAAALQAVEGIPTEVLEAGALGEWCMEQELARLVAGELDGLEADGIVVQVCPDCRHPVAEHANGFCTVGSPSYRVRHPEYAGVGCACHVGPYTSCRSEDGA